MILEELYFTDTSNVRKMNQNGTDWNLLSHHVKHRAPPRSLVIRWKISACLYRWTSEPIERFKLDHRLECRTNRDLRHLRAPYNGALIIHNPISKCDRDGTSSRNWDFSRNSIMGIGWRWKEDDDPMGAHLRSGEHGSCPVCNIFPRRKLGW